MATQTDIPSDLTDDDKASIFQYLDAELNSTILFALLHGIYTGILAVTLWNIFINKYWSIRRTVVFVIILLHALITIDFAVNWSYARSPFIENGQSFWTVYLKFSNGPGQAIFWEGGITATIGTILSDIYIIWCCWMVWGRRWVIVLLPILSQICAIASKIIKEYRDYFNTPEGIFPMLYISFVLVTTLWCTLLIIYRILTVAGIKRGADSRLRVYRHFIEVLVESSALYSISLIVFLALAIRGDFGAYYLDVIAAIAKGVAPTLLIGRAAAGHTRPKEDCDESAVSTLRFRTPSELCATSFQETVTTMHSAVLEIDIEAQPERLVVFVEKTQWCS
ncbi:hypothetical protein ARMSODRAFT_1020583 [Armillaria solidipes]|uniref:Uncharacterized protein n=1 Tax=Armillaria solidipes TaxID=1076256 RepID=A0A2H3BNF7_9AGAR|nr:hypothetical protein ARMSODRAFT_1020583 [Armillaria solidipes]